MKISNETKVGILTITGLTILILGFNFLKGKDLFKKSKKIYAVFKDLGTLSKSNEVKVNGYVIGSVYSLAAKDKDMSGIVATINLSQEVNIPKDSKAMISSPLVGASYIVIQKGTSSEFLSPGDTLITIVDVGLLDDVKEQLTRKLMNNTDDITATIKNAKTASEKLAALELKPTIDSLNAMIGSLKSAAAKISSNDGTLGALLNDKTLYNKLTDAILSAEILMDDLRTNPKRYVNLSIFGKKDKNGPITSPAIKDSIPK